MKAVFEDEEEEGKEKKEEKPSGAAKAEKEDNVELESEDVNEGEEGTTSAKPETTKPAQSSNLAAKEEAKEPEVKRPKNDYALMDLLTSFLYKKEDPIPILCGYFNKVMQQLLVKQKNNTLDYMLVEQNGKIFHGLLSHLQHHSLALLLISLLEIQIQPNQDKKDKARVAWEASEGSDAENDETAEGELTVEQKHMQSVLKEKSLYVVNYLVDQLSNKNQDDYQMTLNAYTVLMEFCDNEHCF